MALLFIDLARQNVIKNGHLKKLGGQMSKKLRIDPHRITLARQALGLKQEDVAQKLKIGKRTYQRIESTDEEPKLTPDELLEMAIALAQWPVMLLAELPMHFEFTGVSINSAAHFVRVFDMSYKFSIEHIPDDPEIEMALIELKDEHSRQIKMRSSWDYVKNSRGLEDTVKIRNLYRAMTSKNKVDKIEFFYVPVNQIQHHYSEPGDVWRWDFEVEIIAAWAEAKSPPKRRYPASKDYSKDVEVDANGEEKTFESWHPGIQNDAEFINIALGKLPEIKQAELSKESMPKFADLEANSDLVYNIYSSADSVIAKEDSEKDEAWFEMQKALEPQVDDEC